MSRINDAILTLAHIGELWLNSQCFHTRLSKIVHVEIEVQLPTDVRPGYANDERQSALDRTLFKIF